MSSMELCDTHCHIQSVGSPAAGEKITRELWAKAGELSADEIIKRAHNAAVNRLICVGCDIEDSRLAISFVQGRKKCWASIGIHPHEAGRYTDDENIRTVLSELCSSPKVVAIGECGLDYHYCHSTKEDQIRILKIQIELAIANDLPLIFHVRDAFDDFWPIFEYYAARHRIRGVLHSFTDSQANCDRAIDHGLFLGVNGIATFTSRKEQQAVYQGIPLTHLLLETDAPFLTPHPYRGKICEPYHIRTIAEFLAEHRSEPVESVAEATTQNMQRLFGVN